MPTSDAPISIELIAKFARRVPDPVLDGAERHFLLVRAKDLPASIPLDPNPREQNANRRIYRDVLKSLMNEECMPDTFHLKNKGITMIASRVVPLKNKDSAYTVYFREGQGIVDGGHTYKIVQEGQASEGLSDRQHVKLEILVGIPSTLITDIAGGLNTSVQVQEMSLRNLDNKFNWIKEALAGEPYQRVIAYKENEADKALDVRDVVAFMTLFNIDAFPNAGSEYPVNAYHSKAKTLREFINRPEPYRKMRSILTDILKLSDIVSFEARELHNAEGGRAGRLSFVEQSSRGFDFPFIDQHNEYKLARGALIPMLGAFRWMVQESPSGNFQWKGSFDDVRRLWKRCGAELMRATQATSDELGRSPDAIGKSRNHWATLHSIVLRNQLVPTNS